MTACYINVYSIITIIITSVILPGMVARHPNVRDSCSKVLGTVHCRGVTSAANAGMDISNAVVANNAPPSAIPIIDSFHLPVVDGSDISLAIKKLPELVATRSGTSGWMEDEM